MENPPVQQDKWVPHENKAALWGYYLAIFSFIPITGIVTGMLALGCGIRGLSFADGHNQVGRKHALFAMGAGTFFLIGQTAIVLFPLLLLP